MFKLLRRGHVDVQLDRLLLANISIICLGTGTQVLMLETSSRTATWRLGRCRSVTALHDMPSIPGLFKLQCHGPRLMNLR